MEGARAGGRGCCEVPLPHVGPHLCAVPPPCAAATGSVATRGPGRDPCVPRQAGPSPAVCPAHMMRQTPGPLSPNKGAVARGGGQGARLVRGRCFNLPCSCCCAASAGIGQRGAAAMLSWPCWRPRHPPYSKTAPTPPMARGGDAFAHGSRRLRCAARNTPTHKGVAARSRLPSRSWKTMAAGGAFSQVTDNGILSAPPMREHPAQLMKPYSVAGE